MQQDYQVIPLKNIKPDPNQPRKFFSEQDQQELTDSIREKGLIQPITVRPYGKGKYMLVCGERRYRSSLAVMTLHKDRNTIPALVRDLSDQEALDLQIIENLQRKDVHPMEEAVAFLRLKDTGSSDEEIAARVGKSASYVAKRIKLNDLTQDCQDVYFAGKMTHTVALQMARLEPEVQEEILESEFRSGWKNKLMDQDVIDDIDHQIRNEYTNLSKTIFKLTDAKLYPEAGACTKCPHNSANQPLLFDDLKGKNCTRISCFDIKTKRARIAKFEEIAADPNVICVVTDSYLNSDEQKQLAAAEEAGIKILDKKLYERTSNHPGEMESFEKWFEWNDHYYEAENSDDEDADPVYPESEMKKARKDYEVACTEHAEEVKKYEDDVASGKFIEAYVVAGGNSGKTILIRLKSDSAKQIAAASAGNSGDADILEEIAKIEAREIRNKELDGEKIWTEIRSELLPNEALVSEKLLNQIGITALVAAIKNKLSYQTRKKAEEYLESAEGKSGNDVIAWMARMLIVDSLPNAFGSHLNEGSDNELAYNYIKDILPTEVAAIELKQQEVAQARAERVEKRINTLRKKLSHPEEA